MIALALALGLSAAPADFRAAFPGAQVVAGASGKRLTSAIGFSAPDLGATPEAAARAFLARHGAAFGLAAGQELRLRSAPRPGAPGAVRFDRRIGGYPLFGGAVVVGVDARGAVTSASAADLPSRLQGRRKLSRQAAMAAAEKGVPGALDAHLRAERGWRATLQVLRPVWRVELTTREPAGEWRCDVDAETGAVLFREDRRVGRGGKAP